MTKGNVSLVDELNGMQLVGLKLRIILKNYTDKIDETNCDL